MLGDYHQMSAQILEQVVVNSRELGHDGFQQWQAVSSQCTGVCYRATQVTYNKKV